MKQYWIARLPPSFLLKRKKPWNSTDVGDRERERRRAGHAHTPHSNEMAKHRGLARDWWVLALWKMLWEAFMNYSLFWEQSVPQEPYPAAQTAVPAAPCALARLQGETQMWPKRPWCHWVGNHFCCPLFAWTLAGAAQPSCTHSTRCHTRSCWHGWGAGRCHRLSALQGHPWEQGHPLPLGLGACRKLTAAEVARSEPSLETCCRVQHLCGALLECKASGADVETW